MRHRQQTIGSNPFLGGLAATAFLIMSAGPLIAARQDRETPPAEPPAKAAEEADPDAPPSLDELLGISSGDAENEDAAAAVAEREAEKELQRRLNENKIGSAFAEAIAKMEISADQLEVHFDTGLGTQRVQEDILAKLDFLLDEAKKQQNSGGSGSSSSAQASSKAGANPGREGGKPQPHPERAPDASDSNPNASEAPRTRDAELNTIFEEERTEWGHLPQRVREMLLQGREEKFSSLYERLTREYYRRLAEEGSP